ncbi:hypothetical protein [uncultured Succiniclasticum sp.]|uniref:hypothetical protein n=1 Tax=uncultured Succiniclasticum sp. TaxID=1500547 RepID=UPI0025E16EFB|nr:hypothetical protein [uncultured Succiniclasticum sp.]
MENKKTYRTGKYLVLPVAKNTTIEAGHMVAVNASGCAVQASKAENLKVAGLAEESVTTGPLETGEITVRRGCFLLANAEDDLLEQPDILGDCYVVDSETVGKTAEGSSKAGRVLGFEDGCVWVEMGGIYE